MKLLIFLPILFLSLASTSASVVQIYDSEFEPFVNNFNTSSSVVVLFFEHSCPFCVKVLPEYDRLSNLVAKFLPSLLFLRIDVEMFHIFGSSQRLSHVPTIRLYRKGEKTIDLTDFTALPLASSLLREFHVHILKPKNEEELNEFVEDFGNLAIYYGKNSDKIKLIKEYLELHENIQIPVAVWEAGNKWRSDKELLILRKNESEVVYFEGKWEVKDLRHFLKFNAFPVVNYFDHKLAQDFFKEDYSLILGLSRVNSKKGEKMIDAFKDVCGEYQRNIRCAVVDTENEYFKTWSEKLGISDDELPQVRIIHGNSEFNISKYKGGKNLIDKNGLRNFVKDYLAGNIGKYFKSEPAPKDNKGPILQITRENFNEIVKNPTYDFLLEVYADWCEQCAQAETVVKTLSGRVRGCRDIKFGKIDITKNDIDDNIISDLPTFLLYPAGEKAKSLRFREDVNGQNLLNFLKLNANSDISNCALGRDHDSQHNKDEL